MKIGPFMIGKDGGPESNVDGFLFEIKSLFSVGLLRFKAGSREAFHSHAFNCWSWLISGTLLEMPVDPSLPNPTHYPGAFIKTRRDDVHKVYSYGTSWVLTFRGPWKKTWVDVEEVREHGPLAHYWMVKTLTNTREVKDVSFFPTRQEAADYTQDAAL